MSKFTTEVRWICESFVPELNWQGEYEHSGYGDIDKALQAGYEHIFDFDFPIWKESYREHLCKLILLHYYTREIAYETYALWKLHLRERLVAIMPKYNLLYKQEELANPFDNIKHTTVGEDTTHTTDNGTSHGESQSTGWNKYNETPQVYTTLHSNSNSDHRQREELSGTKSADTECRHTFLKSGQS